MSSLAGAVETPENSPVRRASASPVLGGSESFFDSAGFSLYANPIRVIRSYSGFCHPEQCEECGLRLAATGLGPCKNFLRIYETRVRYDDSERSAMIF